MAFRTASSKPLNPTIPEPYRRVCSALSQALVEQTTPEAFSKKWGKPLGTVRRWFNLKKIPPIYFLFYPTLDNWEEIAAPILLEGQPTVFGFRRPDAFLEKFNTWVHQNYILEGIVRTDSGLKGACHSNTRRRDGKFFVPKVLIPKKYRRKKPA